MTGFSKKCTQIYCSLQIALASYIIEHKIYNELLSDETDILFFYLETSLVVSIIHMFLLVIQWDLFL